MQRGPDLTTPERASFFTRHRRAAIGAIALLWLAAAAWSFDRARRGWRLHEEAERGLNWIARADALRNDARHLADLARLGPPDPAGVPSPASLTEALRSEFERQEVGRSIPITIPDADRAGSTSALAETTRSLARTYGEYAEGAIDPPTRFAQLKAMSHAVVAFGDAVADAQAQVRATLIVAQRAFDREWLEFAVATAALLLLVAVVGFLLHRSARQTEILTESRHRLAVSERRYRELFEGSGSIKVVVDPRTERIVDANAAAARWYGWSREELVGKPLAELNVLPRERLAPWRREILDGSAAELVLPQRLRSGEVRTAQAYVSRIAGDDGPLFCAILFDITARVAAESAAKDSERRFRALADEVPVLLAFSDPSGNSPFANRTWTQLSGQAPAAATGDGWKQRIHPDDLAQFLARMAQSSREAAPCECEIRFKDAADEWRWLFCRGVPKLDADGKCSGFWWVGLDVTDRKRFEDAQRESQRLEAMGRLAGGVAHDLNNILTVVLGSAEMLLSARGGDAFVKDNAGEIQLAAERAAQLVAQLLSFTRRRLATPVALDLHEAIGSIASLLRRLLGEDIDLVVETRPGECIVEVDPGEFTQVLLNLTLNARQAMAEGGRITVRARALAPTEALPVVLEVADQGVGIDPAARDRLFEPFFTTKLSARHAGIGLATVKGIVEEVGGTIDVESESGRGATFRIRWPAARTDARAAPALPQPGAASGSRRPATILLVEDDASVRPLLRRWLEGAGHRVREAEGGAEALALAAAEPVPDLVITDVVMPDLTGGALAQQLAALHRRMPILFISGYNDDELVRRGIARDDARFLQKPFAREQLLAKVADLLVAAPPVPSAVPEH